MISFWSGLTATPNGGGNNRGIAQSGINAFEFCEWELFFFNCVSEYQGWIEAWPGQQNGVNCIAWTSSSDEIFSEVSWASPNTYYITIWDVTTGAFCTETKTMAMGAPSYGQFQAESDANLIGGYYIIPNFNMWFNTAVVRGDPLNLNSDGAHNSLSIPGVKLGSAPVFNSGVCAGPGESCIQEYT